MKTLIFTGKRKKSIARAVVREGSGVIRVNRSLLEALTPKAFRLRMQEPVILAGESAQKVDIDVKVEGGGVSGQTDAVRLAIAKAIVGFSKDKKLEKMFLDYDRHMLVADVRQREARKPNTHGNARGKTQKSYR
ncbi:MAG: 30S ribosomal protein S9 [Nanoarchaeota archaeon]|nr:MAG: 30S ribosomal protein S9 [Nanoarchaeota archaeon]